jgi:AcrR family transcriptional regulator
MPGKTKAESRRLDADVWREAALRALSEGGLSAVAIEPIAKSLGVTKGSGYWHFKNRDALLAAALEEWELRATEKVILRAREIEDPRARLIALFRQAFTSTMDGRIYLALVGAGHDASVAPVLRRVSKKRIAFLTECYRSMCLTPAQAKNRALVGYASYLGLVMIRSHVSDFGSAQDREDFLQELIARMV